MTAAAASMLSAVFFNAAADEGMWLPALISQRIDDMQEKGFRLTAEDIYSINQASLKDAVVLFGRGCTAELVSDEGLLLTNHHCGYAQIQRHSSVEHDYLKDGFWAMSREEELPNEGLTVSFLDRMEDVTEAVLSGCRKEMTESQRDSLVKARSAELIEQATAAGNGLRATVESLYYGNRYYMFVYREFSDVRLVGAPPSSIGKFGGDTDNWMWPRHTGDFSIFRIYADKGNNPAPYSEDNVPYRPKTHFSISLDGVREGDFTFVYGFPGRTQEYLTAEGVRYVSEISDPHKIALRTLRLEIQRKHMDSDRDIRIRYSSKNASVANAWKKWQGEMKGIRKLGTVDAKKEYERRFEEWAKGTEYEGIVSKIDSVYALLEPLSYARDYYQETAYTIEAASFAMKWNRLMTDALLTSHSDRGEEYRKSAEKLEKTFFADYYLPVDKESFIAVMKEFDRNVPADRKPEYFKARLLEYGSIERWADSLFTLSVFTDSLRLKNAHGMILTDDPALEFARAFDRWYRQEVKPEADALERELNLLYRDYMRGQMEFEQGKEFYPDANLTLRVAYGTVAGYSPADGVDYLPVSTIEGIMEKDDPEVFDYDIPQRLRDIYAEKDYGRWAVRGADGKTTVPVCFLATNHTSGGNSGSPVINADGELVGINFDRVWEGTMSDLDFDPELCRNIALDIRYVLFIIDKVAGAEHLIEEMTFASED